MKFIAININKHKKHILSFRKDSFSISFGDIRGMGKEEEYLEWVRKNSSKFPDGFVLLVDNEKPIGQLELTIKNYDNKQIGYVNLYYLIPEMRGKGLGRKLHEFAMDFFKKHGVSEYHLRVSPTNSQALAFYRKYGMMEIGPELNGKVIRMKGYV